MTDLQGAGVLLTGSSGALGEPLADMLAARGARLFLSDLDGEALKRQATRLRDGGASVEVRAADLLDDCQLDSLIEEACRHLRHVDVLIVGAGVESNARFDRLERHEIEAQLGIHLRVPMLLAHALIPSMIARGRGHVVVVSSLNGKLPFPGKAPYAAAKAGSIAFVHALRRDLRDQPVDFTVVCPALVRGGGQAERAIEESGIEPPSRAGSCTPEECADATVEAIVQGKAEVAVSPKPTAPLAALQWSYPQLADRALELTGMPDFWRRVADKAEAR